MTAWTFLLPRALLEAARAAASSDGRTMSGWVRKAISEKLARDSS